MKFTTRFLMWAKLLTYCYGCEAVMWSKGSMFCTEECLYDWYEENHGS